MEKINLDLGEDSYSIYIGTGLLKNVELLNEKLSHKSVFIITNKSIAPLYLEHVKEVFHSLFLIPHVKKEYYHTLARALAR